jgi:flagellar FliL protein
MAEEEKKADEEKAASGEGEEKASRKPPMMVIAAALVVALGLAAGGAWFMGLFGGGEEDIAAEGVADTPSVYFDMPEMVVNLASSGNDRARYLKLKVALEADSQSQIDSLQPKMPRIQDMFQIYLREMRRSDLEGSAGVYRLKQELMRRINITIHPARIKRVLFKEIIIQ